MHHGTGTCIRPCCSMSSQPSSSPPALVGAQASSTGGDRHASFDIEHASRHSRSPARSSPGLSPGLQQHLQNQQQQHSMLSRSASMRSVRSRGSPNGATSPTRRILSPSNSVHSLRSTGSARTAVSIMSAASAMTNAVEQLNEPSFRGPVRHGSVQMQNGRSSPLARSSPPPVVTGSQTPGKAPQARNGSPTHGRASRTQLVRIASEAHNTTVHRGATKHQLARGQSVRGELVAAAWRAVCTHHGGGERWNSRP